ncbi:hypothetical protein [Aeromonas veronii]|uniref:hypothetical protein n=1 Tax=Aeromonas veronii TaxID=654 RepID=UPI0013DEFB3E|nr:hypothetical protein [Aeromonas veronii]QIF45278.1 hypothetical protein EO082_15405 [Aeromonas veronii]
MTQLKNAVLRLDQRHDLNDCNATIDVDGHSAIAEVVVRMEGQTEDSPELVAFAGRLVACYNLLHGYPTEELEGVTLAEFVASHPELAEKALIAAYASLFSERGATNYLEVKGARPELGPFTITLQRTEGLTPVEKLEAMTKQRDALSSALEWTDEQIMEFISMAFRHAQIKGDFELSDVRDALNMIKARAMSNLEGEQS